MLTAERSHTAFVLVNVLLLIVLTPCGFYKPPLSVLKPRSDELSEFVFRKFFISNLLGNLPKKFEQESKEIFILVLVFHKLEIHRSSLFYTEKG